MTREEIDELYSVDSDDRFKNLVINGKSYKGRKRTELSLDEVVEIKQYASYLYDSRGKNENK